MRVLTRFLVSAIAVVVAVVVAVAGDAAAAGDHDRARRAVEEGRILPLKDILVRAQGAYPGQVIEAELEDEGGAIVYEIKILTADGRVMKLYYNAASGELLKVKGRDGRR
jgi:uncharacterized membrane protein YkoI